MRKKMAWDLTQHLNKVLILDLRYYLKFKVNQFWIIFLNQGPNYFISIRGAFYDRYKFQLES